MHIFTIMVVPYFVTNTIVGRTRENRSIIQRLESVKMQVPETVPLKALLENALTKTTPDGSE